MAKKQIVITAITLSAMFLIYHTMIKGNIYTYLYHKDLLSLLNKSQFNEEDLSQLQFHKECLQNDIERLYRTKYLIENEPPITNQEKSLYDSMAEAFSIMFALPRWTSADYARVGNIDQLKAFILAYGLFPITVPLAAWVGFSEWLSQRQRTRKNLQEIETAIKEMQDYLKRLNTIIPQAI